MAQSIFDALSGNIASLENQSAIQSILESQPAVETSATVEDDDVFQCGKCKKQFTSLSVFVAHKQGRCTPALAPALPRVTTFQPAIIQQGLGSNSGSSAFSVAAAQSAVLPGTVGARTQIPQSVASFNVATAAAVSQSPLTQLTHNMVLTDDQLLTLSDLGQTVQNGILQGSTLHLTRRKRGVITYAKVKASVYNLARTFKEAYKKFQPYSKTGNTVQAAGPFLSQVAQLTPRVSNNMTILSPIQSTTSLAPSNGSAFTSTVTGSSIQPISQATQHITITTGGLPEKPTVQHIIKPSPTKPGRRSLQTTTVDDIDPISRMPRARPGVLADDGSKKKLVCTYCQKVFSKNFDLQQHIRSHTGEKPFQCVVCGRAFAQKSNVKKHMATHKVWPTGAGNTLPSQPPALLVPVEENGKAQVTITTTNPPMVQQQHIQEQDETESMDTSEVHGKVDESQQILTETQNYKVKVVVDNSYLCQYCPEKFKSYYQLKSHMVKHKGVQVYRCVVKKCEATFQDLDMFLEHTTTHTDELSYRCHQCNKSFSSLFELGLHQYTHSLYQQANKSGPRHFQCTKCLNKYATPEALEHHLNTVDHKFPCPHCQKNFTCERFLRRHLISHGTEAQYECPVCRKTFKTEHYLKNHALIHTGEKPFHCEECGATFNRSDKLKRHNLIHDKRMRYRCPFKTVSGCEKEFNRSDKLKAHIITHSGIKPYSCSFCGKEFGRRPHLKEHERAHRAEYPYKCTRCERGFFRPKLFREHKCESTGKKRVFHPRRVKRKPGRPRKVVRRVDTESQDIVIEPVDKNDTRAVIATAIKEKQKEIESMGDMDTKSAIENSETEQAMSVSSDVIVNTASTSCEPLTENIHFGQAKSDTVENSTSIEIHDETSETQKSTRKNKKECYVKLPTSAIPASMVEHYVTVQLTGAGPGEVNEIQAQLIPTGDLAGQLHFSTALQPTQCQISPSASTPIFHPLQIIDSQPVTLTMTHSDQLGSLGVGDASVIDIPVDIVTVSDERALVCTQEVTSCGDAGEQTYASIGDYGTGEAGDVVLQGSESLMNSAVEILGHENVDGITTLES